MFPFRYFTSHYFPTRQFTRGGDEVFTDRFIIEKNKQANQPVYLYKIYDYDSLGNDLLYCAYPSAITFAAEDYTPFPLMHESVGENLSGQVDKVVVRMGNVSRLISGYLELYDLRGKKVRIRTVFQGLLDDPESFMDEIFFIDDYVVTDQAAEFNLSSQFNVIGTMLPARRYNRNFCGWVFKGEECKYAGSQTVCNKTLQRCRELSNVVNFGGFPSIPYKRLIV